MTEYQYNGYGLLERTIQYNELLTGNAPPYVADPIQDQNILPGEVFNFTVPDSVFMDMNGESLSLTATLGNGNALPSWLSFDAATKTFSGTPPNGGAYSVIVTAQDSSGTTVSDVFRIRIMQTNEAPTGNDLTVDGGYSNAAMTFPIGELLAQATDADGDELSIDSVENAINGSVSFDATNGVVSFTPAAGFAGVASFDYVVIDGNGGSFSITASVNVTYATDVGSDVEDTINGSSGDDVIYTFTGNDRVNLYGGNDLVYMGTGDDTVYASSGNSSSTRTVFLEDGSDVYSESSSAYGQTIVYGGDGEDSVTLNYRSDGVVYLGDGNDVAQVESNSNTASHSYFWTGGLGDDQFTTSFGADTFYFNRGDGHDTIRDSSSSAGGLDRIIFGAGITSDDINITSDGKDVIIQIRDPSGSASTDSIIILNALQGGPSSLSYMIEELVFDDGSIITGEEIFESALYLTGTEEADGIYLRDSFDYVVNALGGDDSVITYSGNANRTINLGSGNDYYSENSSTYGQTIIYGGEGEDIVGINYRVDGIVDLGDGDDEAEGRSGTGVENKNYSWTGGLGNDTFTTSRGADTFYFNRGDGHDRIEDSGSTYNRTDRIIFGAGITSGDIKITSSGTDVIIQIDNPNDQSSFDSITLVNGLQGGPSSLSFMIEELVFDDGSIITGEEIFESALYLTGTEEADGIYLRDSFDYVVNALGGDDSVITYSGNANRTINLGGGNDHYSENSSAAGQTIVHGGAGEDFVRINYRVDGIVYLGDGDDEAEGRLGTGVENQNYSWTGGLGNDTFTTSRGGDTFYFNRGDGHDRIEDSGSTYNRTDRIIFGAGITSGDIKITSSGTDVIIQIDDPNDLSSFDSITLVKGLQGGPSSLSYMIEELVFDDGSIITGEEIFESALYLTGTEEADGIYLHNSFDYEVNALGGDDSVITYSGNSNRTIHLGSGNDYYSENSSAVGQTIVYGGNGEDFVRINYRVDGIVDLGDGDDEAEGRSGTGVENQNYSWTGGLGNDTFTTSLGADTFYFNRGDGHDTISDSSVNGATDRIIFGENIKPEHIALTLAGNNYVITIYNPNDPQNNDSITLVNAHASENYIIEELVFDNGKVIQFSEAIIVGTAGEDILSDSSSDEFVLGLNGNDQFTIGLGNDYIDAGTGDDIVTVSLTASGLQMLKNINLGEGDDLLEYDASGLVIVEAGDGDDVLNFNYHTEVNAHLGDGNDLVDFSRAGLATSELLENYWTGGKGDDYFYTTAHSDTFYFNRGDGHDRINDLNQNEITSTDRIIFGQDIFSEHVQLSYDGVNIVLTIVDPNDSQSVDSITIEMANHNDTTRPRYQIEELMFSDGTVFSFEDFVSSTPITGTSDNDSLSTSSNSDVIFTFEGDDTVYSPNGADQIFTGTGNDTVTLATSGDHDVFVDLGAGDDFLNGYHPTNGSFTVEAGEGSDTIRFGRFSDVNADLGAGDDSVRAYSAHQNDYLDISLRNNQWRGGLGNDSFETSASNDTYYFNRGDGHDSIMEYSHSYDTIDRIIFGEGIEQSHVSVNGSVFDVVITITNPDDPLNFDSITLKMGLQGESGNHQRLVEELVFADGSVFDLAGRIDFATYLGTEGDDTYIDSAYQDIMYTFGGDDDITSRGGNDYIDVGDGNDVVELIQGNASTARTVYLGEGDDHLEHQGGGSVTFDAGAGNDYFSMALDYEANGILGQGDDYVTVRRNGSEATQSMNNYWRGGVGNDTFFTANHNDTFYFDRGDGNDIIDDKNYGSNTSTDRIVFGEGISQGELFVEVQNNDLLLHLGGSYGQDSIRIVNGQNDISQIEELVFADGSVVSQSEFSSLNGGGTATPITLDLNGDGLSFNAVTHFDIDNDGLLEETAWVGAGDGLLALDRNSDGLITYGQEISFVGDLAGATTDLEGLAGFDSNNDGVFNALDSRFNDFVVWQDDNLDGVSAPAELASLSALGITEINLTPIAENTNPLLTVDLINTATFTRNGSTHTVGDVGFQYDNLSEDIAVDGGSLVNFLSDWTTSISDLSDVQISEVEYNAFGNIERQVSYGDVDLTGQGILNSTANVTEFIYDAHGNLIDSIAIHNGVATVTSHYAYDGAGRIDEMTNASGLTDYVYDGDAREIRTLNANGLTSTQAFDARGKLFESSLSASNESTRSTQYFYDSAGRLRMSENALGARSWMFYDAAGRVSFEVDAAGAVTGYEYNDSGLVQTETRYVNPVNTSGWFTGSADWQGDNTFSKDALVVGQDFTVTPGEDRETRFDYDDAGRLIRTTEEFVNQDRISETTYDGASRVVETTVGNTRATRYFYSNDGLLLGSVDAEKYFTENVYDGLGRLSQTIRYGEKLNSLDVSNINFQEIPRQGTRLRSFYFHDSQGRQIGMVNEQGFLTETVYLPGEKQVNTLTYTQRLNRYPAFYSATTLEDFRAIANEVVTSETHFDDFGRVERQVAPDGTETINFYDDGGRLTRTSYASGTEEERNSVQKYNAFGEVTGQASGVSQSALTNTNPAYLYQDLGVEYTYNQLGQITLEENLGNEQAAFFYDDANRLSFTINREGDISQSEYNTFSEIEVSRNLYNSGNFYVQDPNNPFSLIWSANGGQETNSGINLSNYYSEKDVTSTNVYNQLGLLSQQLDGQSTPTDFHYNEFGELTQKDSRYGDGLANSDRFYYDDVGRLTHTIQNYGGANVTTATLYDGFGRVRDVIDANHNTTHTDYWYGGNQVRITDAENKLSITDFDAFGRVTREQSRGTDTRYHYDNVAREKITTTGDIVTRELSNRHGEVARVEDGNNTPLAEANRNFTQYNYSGNGYLSAEINPLGHQTTYERYFSNGRIRSVFNDLNYPVKTYTYDNAGRVSIERNGNEPTSSLDESYQRYRYNGLGLKSSVDFGSSSVSVSYEYDTNGRIDTETDPLGYITKYHYYDDGTVARIDKGTEQNPTLESVSYVYDALGRKVSETIDPDGFALTTEYRYDKLGNVTKTIDADGNNTWFLYNDVNQLTFSINSAGEVTENVYDEHGRSYLTKQYFTPVSDARLNLNANAQPGTFTPPAEHVNDRLHYTIRDEYGRERFTVTKQNQDYWSITENVYDKNSNIIETRSYDKSMEQSRMNAMRGDGVIVHGEVQSELRNLGYRFVSWGYSSDDDQLAQRSHFVYDAANQLRFTLQNTGQDTWTVSENVYDGIGNVVETRAFDTFITDSAVASRISEGVSEAEVISALKSSGQAYAFNNWGDQTESDVNTSRTVQVYDIGNRVRFSLSHKHNNEWVVSERVYDTRNQVVEERRFDKTLTSAQIATISDNGFTNVEVESILRDVGYNFSGIYDWGSGGQTNNAQDAQRTQYAYDLNGQLRFTLDAEGFVSEFQYDHKGNRVASIRYANAPAVDRFSSNWFQNAESYMDGLVDKTDSRNQITHFVYDSLNRNTFVVNGENYVTQNEFDVFGQVIKTTQYAQAIGDLSTLTESNVLAQVDGADSENRVTRFVYDNEGQLVRQVNDRGYHEEEWVRSAARHTASDFVYDTFGNLVAKKDGLIVFLDNDSVFFVNEELARTTRYVYDSAGDLRYSIDALGFVEQFDYDARGQMYQSIRYANSAENLSTQLELSISGVESATSSLSALSGHVKEYVYNALGQRIYEIESDETLVQFNYSARGHLESRQQFDLKVGQTGKYIQAPRGMEELNALVDGLDLGADDGVRGESYLYDSQGRLASKTDALNYIESYTYDSFGNRKTLTDKNQKVWTYEYDKLNRLTREISPEETIHSDAHTPLTVKVINAKTYDAFGNITKTENGILGELDADGNVILTDHGEARTTRYVYDNLGHQVYTIDALNYIAQNDHNAFGEVYKTTTYYEKVDEVWETNISPQQVENAFASMADSQGRDRWVEHVFDAVGRKLYTIESSDILTKYEYNNHGELSRTSTYAYSAGDIGVVDGGQRSIEDLNAATLDDYLGDGTVRGERYHYDELGRIISTTDAKGYIESYTYDAFGNRKSFTNKKGSVWTYKYTRLNQLKEEISPDADIYYLGGVSLTGLWLLKLSTTISVM